MAQENYIVSKGRKRKLEELEVDEVESLDETLSTACVHGVISTLSPIKKGCKSNYFDGSVSDGKSNIRLVGFNPSQRIRMKNLMKNKQAVKIDDCEVRHARRGQSMEILLKGSTKISMSPRKFEFSNILIQEEITPLSDLESKGVYDRVSVHIKVGNITHPTEVPTGKKKQDVIIVDGSGSGKCVLWGENIGNLKGECYLLKNFVVRVRRQISIHGQGFIQDFKLGGETRGVWGHAPRKFLIFTFSEVDSDAFWVVARCGGHHPRMLSSISVLLVCGV